MTIRSTFQPTVDEFIDTLHSFATGSYLKPEEKEYWDQPFDPTVLPELRTLLEKLLDNLDDLPADPPADALQKMVQVNLDELTVFNETHQGAVLEPEEKEELAELIHAAAAATGADDEALAELPDLD